MEVTKSNFNEKLPYIEKAIEEAEFLAIDGELDSSFRSSLCGVLVLNVLMA